MLALDYVALDSRACTFYSGVWLNMGKRTWIARTKTDLLGGGRTDQSILDDWLRRQPNASRLLQRTSLSQTGLTKGRAMHVASSAGNRSRDDEDRGVKHINGSKHSCLVRKPGTPPTLNTCCAAIVCTPQLQVAQALLWPKGGKDVFPAAAAALGVQTVQIENSKYGAELMLATPQCMGAAPESRRETPWSTCVAKLRAGANASLPCQCDDQLLMLNCRGAGVR